jgi:hypothetical protein
MSVHFRKSRHQVLAGSINAHCSVRSLHFGGRPGLLRPSRMTTV